MRPPQSRLHLLVLLVCVAGCVAVSMWPRDEPLPGPRAVGAEVKAALERTLGLDLPPPQSVPSRRDHRESVATRP